MIKSAHKLKITEKELLIIVETLKDFQKILLGHGIEVFTDHNNLTYETIESASHCIQPWNSLIKEFGVTLLYIKGEDNVVSDDISWITMAHHARKVADMNLEEYTCELMCVDSLLIYDNIDCLSLDIEEI